MKANLSCSRNFSEILSVICKFICDSTPT